MRLPFLQDRKWPRVAKQEDEDMPLTKSGSKKAFAHNVKAEIHAGKPQKQAVAIAYATKRKAEHMHSGGMIRGADMPKHYAEGGYAKGATVQKMKRAMGYGNMMGVPRKEEDHMYAQEHSMHPFRHMAEGGMAMKDHMGEGMEAEEMDMMDEHEMVIDQCVMECMEAIKSGDKAAFRDAFHVLVSDALMQMSDEEEEERIQGE